MKYTLEITINKSRDAVIALFDDPDNLAKWQPGLVSFEHVSGVEGETGAKSKMEYDMNGRQVEMIETIVTRNLPDEFSATYEADGVWNFVSNRFYEDGADKTRWVTENEFNFSGFMRLMSKFMGRVFKKQTLEHMNNFKDFAESAESPGKEDLEET